MRTFSVPHMTCLICRSINIYIMKHLIVLLSFLFSILIAYGQTNKTQSFQYREGDELNRSDATFKQFDGAGDSMVWDISDVDLLGSSPVSFSAYPYNSDIISSATQGRREYFIQDNRHIQKTGYESRIFKVNLTTPEITTVFPVEYGNASSGTYNGRAVYSERVMMRIFGTYEVTCNARGTLKLSDGYDLKGVVKINYKKQICSIPLHFIKTEKALQEYTDSIHVFTTDSIINKMTTSDIFEIQTNRWYAQGYRYPIYETVIAGSKGETPSYMRAYYYSPYSQELMLDTENQSIRDSLDSRDNYADMSSKPDDTTIPHYEVRVDDGTVTITYDAKESYRTEFLVCNTSGMVYRHYSHSCNLGQNQVSINCGDLRPGEYILYIRTNETTINKKIRIG